MYHTGLAIFVEESPGTCSYRASQATEDGEVFDRVRRLKDAEAKRGDEKNKDDEAMYWTYGPHARVSLDAAYGPTTRHISFAEARQRLRRMHQDYGMPSPEKRRARGCLFPKRFIPPNKSITPLELFSGAAVSAYEDTQRQVLLYAHRDDPKTILVFADGACLNNGQANPKTGWAVHHGPGTPEWPRLWLDRLESKGPFGDPGVQTNNRAELRAVIAAMRCKDWCDCDYRGLVIATDSKLATEGATKWAKNWIKNGWKTRAGDPVANKDLWQLLLGEMERMAEGGLVAQLWKIPREWNTYAHNAAKAAAAWDNVPPTWIDV